MNNPSLTTALLLVFLLSCLAGCSSKPKPAEGEKAMRDRVATESEGRIKLITFKKIGDVGIGGPDSYTWDYEADLEITADCVWLYDNVSGTLPIDFRTAIPAAGSEGKPMRTGQRYRITGSLSISTSKQGWKADHIGIRSRREIE